MPLCLLIPPYSALLLRMPVERGCQFLRPEKNFTCIYARFADRRAHVASQAAGLDFGRGTHGGNHSCRAMAALVVAAGKVDSHAVLF